ncbi:energy-coupling factor transporter transmembrane component T family protein [Aquibacillus albus]|uniref:Energy-coupling factor transport system permease protein n=1 Tax=Aquibacillus albus TaxID=1168171 RepID=A0ABS2N234_9BACI|nr:energy-coupling factor transporter transmembrane component T [Aquibacillus albus]MBM7572174.1 energy-coupling factor transport system permease protein [Aquibacillus albus]
MFIHNVNPSIKAITIIVSVFLLALVFDPITPLCFVIWIWILTIGVAKIHWKKYLVYFSPFFIFALGMFWTNVMFANEPNNPADVITLFGREFPTEDVNTALALSLRILSFTSLSLLFLLTTNIVHFILSLMQQCKLPPKLAYGILAGYRFLPMMKDELVLIHAAHRVRGVNRAKTMKEAFQQYKRFAIPLLASAIRKAERTAIAMESKGFTGSRDRTFYRQFTIGPKDWLFLVMMLGMLLIFITVSWQLGYLKWYSGEF